MALSVTLVELRSKIVKAYLVSLVIEFQFLQIHFVLKRSLPGKNVKITQRQSLGNLVMRVLGGCCSF